MPPVASGCTSSRRLLAGLVTATLLATIAGCDVESREERAAAPPPAVASAAAPARTAGLAVGSGAARPFAPARPDCTTIEVFAAGAPAGAVCVDEVASRGLTTIDLSDTWTPRVFQIDARTGKAPDHRAKYLELARTPGADLGLYGVAPAMTVLAARLSDEKRRACDAAVDVGPIADALGRWSTAPDADSRAAILKSAGTGDALRAMQGELACSGHLPRSAVGTAMGSRTQNALDAFRRRHMIVGAGLDPQTLEGLSLGGDELALRGLLRGLRERVAEAAGLVEDGSASGDQALVADRKLDLSRFALGGEPLDEAAPDLVGQAADAAARALGWTSPDGARAFLAARGEGGLRALKVAVALPARPAYHSATMDLFVEIDRGDVSYELPGRAAAARAATPDVRHPSLVLHVKDGDTTRALVRWPTTIGGWKKERTKDGELVLEYKESDVGDRVWRQIIAAPAWMPPDSTPETDLLRETKDGTFELKRDLIMPGHRNAYGLAMIIHHEAVTKGDETTFLDHGIRTHGSVDFRSIGRGTSHGCHRLHNQLVLRLTGYLLQHRAHVARGSMRAGYQRTLEWNEQTIEVEVPHRGTLYELDPPVPVRVLPGRVIGEKQAPISRAIALEPPSAGRG